MKLRIFDKCLSITLTKDMSQLPIGTEITFKGKTRTVRSVTSDSHEIILENGTCLNSTGFSGGVDQARLAVMQMLKLLLRKIR